MMTKETLLDNLRKKYPIENEVCFNEFSIQEKLTEQPKLLMKYWDLYQKSQFKKDQLLNDMIDLRMNVYDRLRFENSRNLSKVEIENFYINADPDIKSLQGKIDMVQVYINYFELCYKSVNQLQWNIKTYLQNKEL